MGKLWVRGYASKSYSHTVVRGGIVYRLFPEMKPACELGRGDQNQHNDPMQ